MKKHPVFDFVMVSLLCFSSALFAQTNRKAKVVVPTQQQVEWANCEMGVLIHFDMPVFEPDYDWTNFGTQPSPKVFNPTQLNTDQWLATAKKLGAKYAVLVAKHCSGFSLWPTKTHDYNISHSPWKNGKGDIVADFIRSCKKYGIKPGIYASTSANGYLHVNAHKVDPKGPVTLAEYKKIVGKQLTELWGNYGKLFEVWFDGGLLSTAKGGVDAYSLLKKLQPQAIAFQGPYGYKNLIRWVGNEEGAAPYPCWATAGSTTNADGTIEVSGLHGNSKAPYWCPGESDFTLRWNRSFQGGWFWHAGEDSKMFTIKELLKKYETSVGHNTNMLLGMVVDNRGLVPDADVQRIEAIGKEIQRQYGHPFKTIYGTGNTLIMNFAKPISVDRVVIQEDIRKGERVLSYELQGKVNGNWVVLATGSNIGHKHIDRFNAQKLRAIRLVVKESKATPQILKFAVYKTL